MRVYEDSDCEDYTPMTKVERNRMLSMMAAILVGILCGCLIGFVAGFKFFKGTHECPVVKHQIGYSVIDSSTIKTCCGDVRKYNWQLTSNKK